MFGDRILIMASMNVTNKGLKPFTISDCLCNHEGVVFFCFFLFFFVCFFFLFFFLIQFNVPFKIISAHMRWANQ